jgi:hypothetical protein
MVHSGCNALQVIQLVKLFSIIPSQGKRKRYCLILRPEIERYQREVISYSPRIKQDVAELVLVVVVVIVVVALAELGQVLS